VRPRIIGLQTCLLEAAIEPTVIDREIIAFPLADEGDDNAPQGIDSGEVERFGGGCSRSSGRLLHWAFRLARTRHDRRGQTYSDGNSRALQHKPRPQLHLDHDDAPTVL
jgi:hypothetical protein